MIKSFIKMVITLIVVLVVVPQISSVRAEAPQPEVDVAIANLHKTEYTKEEIITLIGLYAEKYDVDARVMQQIVYHESQYNPNTVGDFGKSFGLSQIHLPSHPTITKEQARDPHFALTFLAENLRAGRGRMWTAYRLCINNEKIVYRGEQLFCNRLG